MESKSSKDLRELLAEDFFHAVRKDTAYARPTVPGETVLADNFNGQVVFADDGYVVTEDGHKNYYTNSIFYKMFEVISDGAEGPGNSRTYKYKGKFKAFLYTGEQFVYRPEEGSVRIVTKDTYIIDFFNKFLFVDKSDFKKNWRVSND